VVTIWKVLRKIFGTTYDNFKKNYLAQLIKILRKIFGPTYENGF
jgi:hypothetical protein